LGKATILQLLSLAVPEETTALMPEPGIAPTVTKSARAGSTAAKAAVATSAATANRHCMIMETRRGFPSELRPTLS